MFMRTERLFLRPVFPEDWRGVYRGIADEGVVRNLARAPWPYCEEDAQSFCAMANSDARTRFVVTLPEEDGAVIGMIGFEQVESGGDEVGYWIAPAFHRQGYATEALRGVTQIADALGTPLLEAGHFVDNPASGKVLRNSGFVPSGETRVTHSTGRGGAAVPMVRFVRQRGGVLSDTPAAA
ncbi:MAG: GNAT family N-acetyltransferase [Alteraurantiacibacter sp.]